jgi:hypothetical protein
MCRFLISAVAFIFFTTSASADQFFYSAEKLWTVYGVNNIQDKNPACIAQQSWRDGSYIQLIKDLADDELYIAFTNTEWQIVDQPGTYGLQVNGYVGSDIHTFTFDYTLVPKNTIMIRGIIADKFIPVFAAANKLRFVMPGTITNADIHLNGSRSALDAIIRCMDKFKASNLSSTPKKKDFDL